MCIIVYRPKNIKTPSRKTLCECYDNNPDGAGFMFIEGKQVHIKKGFTDFKDFYKEVQKVPSDSPLVMHFRISTQGGIKRELTHPFPLCDNYEQMRLLNSKTDIGIAHNGIISLTSEYVQRGTLAYNDTMTFIRDYATLIITEPTYYKDKNKLKLLEKLCGSKLAIMSKDGNVTLIGQFIEDGGCFYSNSTYKPCYYGYVSSQTNYKGTDYWGKSSIFDYDNYGYTYDDWADAYWTHGGYDFNEKDGSCPNEVYGKKISLYCQNCKNADKCASRFKFVESKKKSVKQ